MSEKEEEEEEKVSPSSVFLSQISQIWCLILSHPLYFSYILFLSPYILKVLSFLSPLIFTTTFLLLLPSLFFTFSHSQNQIQNQFPEDLEWFNNFFNSSPSEITIIIQSSIEVAQEPEIKKEICNTAADAAAPVVLLSHVNKEDIAKYDHHIIDQNGMIIKRLEANIKSSFLGCKKVLEEEEDEDEMDLLWEKYEDKEKLVNNMGKLLVEVDQEEENKNKDSFSSKKKDLRSLVNHQKEIEEEEEEEANGKICCLQALKFSTAKMRFGMGKKSGFRKISKAFKGLKLLNQLVAKNGKNNTHS